jgi:hypothetical protein
MGPQNSGVQKLHLLVASPYHFEWRWLGIRKARFAVACRDVTGNSSMPTGCSTFDCGPALFCDRKVKSKTALFSTTILSERSCLAIPGTATRTAYKISPPRGTYTCRKTRKTAPSKQSSLIYYHFSCPPFLVPSSMPSFHGWDSSDPCASPLWGNPKYLFNPRKRSFPPIVTERNVPRPSRNPTQNESSLWGVGILLLAFRVIY